MSKCGPKPLILSKHDIASYVNGTTSKQIANYLHVSVPTILYALRRVGIKIRAKGRPRMEQSARNKAILNAWNDSQPASKIGVSFNVSKQRIYQIVMAQNGTPRQEDWNQWYATNIDGDLGKLTDKEIAQQHGLSKSSVTDRRNKLRIPCAPKSPNPKRIDLTGQRFGRLVVSEIAQRTHQKHYGTMWLCQCDCGNSAVVSANNLKLGRQRSCGCLKREMWANGGGRRNKGGFRPAELIPLDTGAAVV